MIDKIKNIFAIPDLRKKILFTLFILFIYRIGAHIPIPGINPDALSSFFSQSQGTLFGLFDMFVGGAFKRATIFALGIMPYISASIIIQLLGTVIPSIQQLQKEGQEGRAKITQYTRYGTLALASVQALGISVWLLSIPPQNGEPIIVQYFSPLRFKFFAVLSLTTGTVFIMWLGEQITARGIGNGISLIIFIGIVARLPYAIMNETKMLISGTRSPFLEIVILAFIFAMVAFIVLVTLGQRRIPIQTPKRVVGRKMYGGASNFLPLRVNQAGVIPVIFASSIMAFPQTLATFMPDSGFMEWIANRFTPGALLYNAFFGLLIVFFTYFYTAITFNPLEVADNLKKQGSFIPGKRPGRKTAQYLDTILTRITLPGAIFLALIAIAPFLLINVANVSFFFGGTSVLIVVGVALDTLQQIESQLMMRHYDGFLKKGRIRGRRG
ncbi:MAG: preprotein translocase subunit SecY [Fibrobacterota bacterium]